MRAVRLATMALCVTLGVTLCACATRLGNNVGAELSGTDRTVTLTMSEQHAWLPLLQRQGADLIAEYKTPAGGLVRETVSPSQHKGLDFTFQLPAQLRGEPSGPICLYVQLRNRTVLPVRKRAGSSDTARFREIRWESRVQAASALRRQQSDLNVLSRQAQDADNAVRGRAEALANRGWATASTCEAVPAGEAEPTRPPLGVIPLDRHHSAAKQVCVGRALYAQRLQQHLLRKASSPDTDESKRSKLLSDTSQLAGNIEELAKIYAGQTGRSADATVAAVLTRRQQQAREFLGDFTLFAPSVQKEDYYPLLGAQDDYLGLIAQVRPLQAKAQLLSIAAPLGLPADKRPTLSANDILALTGGHLDSYFGCVSDAQRQLRVKLDAWTDLQRESPERNRRIREHFVKECRAQHSVLAQLQQEQTRLAAQRDAATADLARQEAATTSGSQGASRVALNQQACD